MRGYPFTFFPARTPQDDDPNSDGGGTGALRMLKMIRLLRFMKLIRLMKVVTP